MHSITLMTPTKILCPVDFSSGSQRALLTAARIAAETGGELVVVHAWYIPPSAYSVEAPFPAELTQQIVIDAEKRLADILREQRDGGLARVSVKLLSGVPWAQVVTELESEPYDLCVLGTQGRTGLARVLLGSVAAKIVRHAPCSVLAVRPDTDAKPFRHVLVPTDFSPQAQHALDIAPTFVAPDGKLTLMHVIEVPVDYAGAIPIGDFVRDIDRHASNTLEVEAKRLATATSVPIVTSARIGYPGAETLAAIAADPTIDLVVLGTHGRTGIKRVLLGSVAEKVMRHARCPVLIARKRG